MTHIDLLRKIQSDYEENKHFRDDPKHKPFAALRAVVELHKPSNRGFEWLEEKWCSICLEEQGDYMSPIEVKYPCATIQAILKELN